MSWILIGFSCVAAVVGAGLASGTEICLYFLKYGKISFLGVVLSSFGFSLFSRLILRDCREMGISSFGEYISRLMPPFWAKIMNGVVFVYMTAGLAAMTAAAGEIIGFLFGTRVFFGSLVFAAFCAVLLCGSDRFLTKINGVLGILIVFGIVLSCYYIINYRYEQTFSRGEWVLSATAYTAYNGISGAVILCANGKYLKSKREKCLCSALFGVGIFAILGGIWCAVGIFYGKINLGEIPMLTIAARGGKIFYFVYSIILFAAVLTTALANGFGITESAKKNMSVPLVSCGVCAFSMILSRLGFSNVVDKVYRACGYVSFIFPVFILINDVKRRKTKKKKDML